VALPFGIQVSTEGGAILAEIAFSAHGTALTGPVPAELIQIVINEGLPSQVFAKKSFRIFLSDSDNKGPGCTGLDWVTVDILDGKIDFE